MPAFSGGTSLSKGWELIKRFSEDIDFKVGEPPAASAAAPGASARRLPRADPRRAAAARFRARAASRSCGDEAASSRRISRIGAQFGAGQGLRPHIRVEMSFQAPALPPIDAADPLADRRGAAATARSRGVPLRRCRRDRGRQAERARLARAGARARRDPTTIRPSSGICTIWRRSSRAWPSAPHFRELVLTAVAADVGRGGERTPPADPATIFADMLRRLETDPLWAREYEDFVRQVSFAEAGREIHFADALAAITRLVRTAYEGI